MVPELSHAAPHPSVRVTGWLAAFALVSIQSPFVRTTVKMFQSVAVVLMLAAAASAASPGRCPENYGVQVYPNEAACDRFYKVRRGMNYLGLLWVKSRSSCNNSRFTSRSINLVAEAI